jgi:hypothetical protein
MHSFQILVKIKSTRRIALYLKNISWFQTWFCAKTSKIKNELSGHFKKGVFFYKSENMRVGVKRGWNRLAAKTVLILRILLCRLSIFRRGDGRRSGGGGGIKGIVRGGVASLA